MNSLPDEIINKIYQHYFTENCIQEFYKNYYTGSPGLFHELKPTINLSKKGPNKMSLIRINKDYKTFINWEQDYNEHYHIYWQIQVESDLPYWSPYYHT